MHLLWEQPTVTCNNKLLASLGGLIMPPSYFTLSFSNPLESLFVSRNKKGVNLMVNPSLFLAGSMGLEPTPSGVTGRRYNHLNYDPKMT